MTNTSKLAALCGAVGLALIAISGTAAADGYEVAAPAAAVVDCVRIGLTDHQMNYS